MEVVHMIIVKNTKNVHASKSRHSRNTHQFRTRTKNTMIVHAT
jgi:hypothetical protein